MGSGNIPENVAKTHRGRDLSAPASPVNPIVGRSEPVSLSSPCEALLEPRGRTFSRRESWFGRRARAKTPSFPVVFCVSLTDVRMTVFDGRGCDRCPSVALLEPENSLGLLTRA